jgi:hypothetical protein
VKRWEYRQSAFAEPSFYPENDGIPVLPWVARRDGSAAPFGSEQDWLTAMGAEGWELLYTEPHSFPGRVAVAYVPTGSNYQDVRGVGHIPAKRWTFRREVGG